MGTDTMPGFLLGVHKGWHAIEDGSLRPGCTAHAWSLCAEPVRMALDEDEVPRPYDVTTVPGSYNPCPACRWIAAARTGTLEAVLATLSDPLAHGVAAVILRDAARDYEDDDDPRVMQLLTAVSRHAPVDLLSEGCAEGDCEHEDGRCPARQGCRACSLQAEGWGGEWEGQYLDECTITSPCAPLLALAKHYGVEVPGGN
jgi:hypothetical protein